MQILFTPCCGDWYQYYLNLSRWTALPSTGVINPHLPTESDILAKVTKEGFFAVAIRTFADSRRIVDVVSRNFIQSFNAVRQRLVWNQRQVSVDELLARKSRGEGMLLNSDELAAIASFPSAAVKSYALERTRIQSTGVPPEYTENL